MQGNALSSRDWHLSMMGRCLLGNSIDSRELVAERSQGTSLGETSHDDVNAYLEEYSHQPAGGYDASLRC